MRHASNHRGNIESCVTCAKEEEIDKHRKIERKVMRIATPVSYSEASKISGPIRTEATP